MLRAMVRYWFTQSACLALLDDESQPDSRVTNILYLPVDLATSSMIQKRTNRYTRQSYPQIYSTYQPLVLHLVFSG